MNLIPEEFSENPTLAAHLVCEPLELDFKLPEAKWKVCSLVWLNDDAKDFLSTSVEHLDMPMDLWWNYSLIWEIITTDQLQLSRVFNTRLGRKRWWELLQQLFSLDCNYLSIRWARLWWDARITHCYPFPHTLNKTTTKEVRAQIDTITSRPLRSYENKSIHDLLCGADCTQTFWDFCMTCLKKWIPLKP